MNHRPDVERLVERALHQRSTDLGPLTGGLDDISARVDRRRAGRRNIAVVGSLAVVGVGLVGIIALGGDRDDAPAAAQPGQGESAEPAQQAWRCDQQLDYWGEDGDEVYWASCEQVSIPADAAVLDVPPTTAFEPNVDTTVVGTYPTESTAPATESIPPTTAFEPDRDDPVLSPDGPICTPGDGAPVECALIDQEQRYTVNPGDSLATIARRYRLAAETLAGYNRWPDGIAHPIVVGDNVRIPPISAFTGDGTATATTAPGG